MGILVQVIPNQTYQQQMQLIMIDTNVNFDETEAQVL